MPLLAWGFTLHNVQDSADAIEWKGIQFSYKNHHELNSSQLKSGTVYTGVIYDVDSVGCERTYPTDLYVRPASKAAFKSSTDSIDFHMRNEVKRYTDTVVIFAYISPVADFTPTPTEANAGETFNFIDASTKGDGKLVKWSWDFGDDEVDSTEQNPSHIYENTSGYITVTLVVTDEYGCKSTVQKQVLVTESMSFPNVLTPDATVGGEPCVFRPMYRL